jgi:hypothetical protein
LIILLWGFFLWPNDNPGREVKRDMQENVAVRDTYLTEKETAAITKEALATLRNNRSMRRGLPYLKIRRAVRYKLSDVIAYMERQRIDPEGVSE